MASALPIWWIALPSFLAELEKFAIGYELYTNDRVVRRKVHTQKKTCCMGL